MKKKKKISSDKHSVELSKNHHDDNPGNRDSNPDDPSEETEQQIKEMPLSDNPNHPHNEEILDDIPN